MRVLIADKFEKIGIDGLKELGCDEYQGFFESPALQPAEFEKKYSGR